MDIRALGYIGVDVADVDAWQAYAALLGTMTVPSPTDDGFRIKVDDRPYRVIVQPSPHTEGLAFAGWEVPDEPALEAAAAELEQAGRTVRSGSRETCAGRGVRGLIETTDPSGLALELFHGPIHDHELFASPSGVSGFVTGDLGLGHIVLATPVIAESVHFYTEILGFRVSDYMGAGDDDVVFTHCNPRHHSLALVPAGELELYHFMLEAQTIDDVGYTLDRLRSAGTPISMDLGRHPNDRMLSFYSTSPSGFDVEFGCGGILIDDDTWSVSQISQPSVWGHRRPEG
ncbi:MAG: iron-dependent extradiol dioxygenase [Acidimicrobiales bacterium]|nr:MAG: iron-dependent extradiol dioxygenase [Acidimicrobiales bacterium]